MRRELAAGIAAGGRRNRRPHLTTYLDMVIRGRPASSVQLDVAEPVTAAGRPGWSARTASTRPVRRSGRAAPAT